MVVGYLNEKQERRVEGLVQLTCAVVAIYYAFSSCAIFPSSVSFSTESSAKLAIVCNIMIHRGGNSAFADYANEFFIFNDAALARIHPSKLYNCGFCKTNLFCYFANAKFALSKEAQ